MKIQPFTADFFSHLMQARAVGVLGVKNNLCPVSRHMPFSTDPFLYGISLSKETLSFQHIENTEQYTLQFFPYTEKSTLHALGKTSGKFVDKYMKHNIPFITDPETQVRVCTESVSGIIFEKKEILDYGDHAIVVGEAVAYWNNASSVAEISPILFYGRGWYGSVEKPERIPRNAMKSWGK